MLGPEEPGPGPAEEAPPDTAAEQVPELVARHRGDRGAGHHEGDVQVDGPGPVGRRQQSGGDEQGVAGQEEPEEQARFGEDHRHHPGHAECVDQVGRVKPAHQAGTAIWSFLVRAR